MKHSNPAHLPLLLLLLLPLLGLWHNVVMVTARDESTGPPSDAEITTEGCVAAASSSSSSSSSDEQAPSKAQHNATHVPKVGLSDGIVHELDLENFVPVIGSSSFTLVLFYDVDDPTFHLQVRFSILKQLAIKMSQMVQPTAFFARNLEIKFAKLNIRKHSYIRSIYGRHSSHKGLGGKYNMFYRDYDTVYDDDNFEKNVSNTILSSRTFMKLKSRQLPTLPATFMIFSGADYNVLSVIDDEAEVNGVPVDDLNYTAVGSWLGQELREYFHIAMEGVGKPHLPFHEDYPKVAITSRLVREEHVRKEYHKSNSMDSIDWDKADEMARNQKKLKDVNAELDTSFYSINVDEQGDSFYRYKLDSEVDDIDDEDMMESLGLLFSRYLAWADSYENLWDDERKIREDQKTNYGFYLQAMNEAVRDAPFSVYDDLEAGRGDFFFQADDIPALKDYYEDVLFGFGRSPSSLWKYIQQVVLSSDELENGEIELFDRIREYMLVYENVMKPKSRNRYQMFFRALWIKIHAILAEFQTNITHHYIAYATARPEEERTRNTFESLDVIDMNDPSNLILLSDFDEFERQYASLRKPYVLSNVNLTGPFNYTLEFLVEVCGFMDVTKKVKESVALGDESVKRWGGLKQFKLPEELFAGEREDGEISLQQFVALMERFSNIYLHDWKLKDTCGSLFWSKTPYDLPDQQYFRVPSVIGRYDLFQRVPYSSYSNSWPSLFIGRKGTNSKLHIDSGATGFWMYLVSGRKRWVLYDRSEIPFLYERLESSSFIADVLALNSTENQENQNKIYDYFAATYPLLSRPSSESGAYEFIQEPGQLIYIPPDTPHAVENLEDIVGISFNLAPRTGIAQHLHSELHEYSDFASIEIALRYLMEDGSLSPVKTNDPLYTTLGEYVAQ